MKATVSQLVGSGGKLDRLSGVVFFGSDPGLIREGSAALVAEVCDAGDSAFRLSTLAREQHARLRDESTAQSLIGGRRVVRVQDAADSLLAVVRELDETSALLLLEGPSLTSRSKLRLFAEAAPGWAAVACHAKNGVALQAEIKRDLSLDAVQVSDEALHFVADQSASDRSLRRAQSESLALYAGPNGALDLDDVRACLTATADRDLDDGLFAAMAGEVEATDAALTSLAAGDLSGPGILASVNYHVLKVLRARRHLDGGASREAAIRSVIPPIFFQRQSIFAESLRVWAVVDLLALLDRVRAADLACKRAGSADVVIATWLLMSLARQAASRRVRAGRYERPSSIST